MPNRNENDVSDGKEVPKVTTYQLASRYTRTLSRWIKAERPVRTESGIIDIFRNDRRPCLRKKYGSTTTFSDHGRIFGKSRLKGRVRSTQASVMKNISNSMIAMRSLMMKFQDVLDISTQPNEMKGQP